MAFASSPYFRLLLFLGIAFPGLPLQAGNDVLTGQLTVHSGQEEVRAELHLRLPDGWAVFTNEADFGGLPSTVEWTVPEHWSAKSSEFPRGEWARRGGLEEFFWSGEMTLSQRWTVDGGAPAEPALEVLLEAMAVSPGGIFHPQVLTLTYGDRALLDDAVGPPEESFWAGLLDRSPLALLIISLAGGFIGGLILNVMPCILPVIGIKVMSLVKHAGDDPAKAKRHGWTFTAGVVVSFWILAAVVMVLQGLGTSVGQGFHLQNFPFVIFITSLIFLLALSMMGVFLIDLGSGGYQQANKLAGKSGYAGSFFNGFLVTLLSTPCSAPILAGAMTFAFTQPPLLSFTMFTSIALGLAFPYTLLGHKPHWVKFLPKPGMWMEYFKQIMGFLMMSMVIFLLTVVEAVRGGSGVVWTVAWLLVLGMIAWLYGTFVTGKGKRIRRRAQIAMAILLVIGVTTILEGPLKWRMSAPDWAQLTGGERSSVREGDGLTARTNPGGVIPWYPYREDTFATLLEREQPVFVNFTAAWCITCKVNEQRAMEREDTRALMEELGVIAIYGDWTDQNEEIRLKLAQHERVGVPLNLVYGRDRNNPVILPELFSAGRLHRALEEAASTFR